MISGGLIGRYLPVRPSSLGGLMTPTHPTVPENNWSEEWLENEVEDMYDVILYVCSPAKDKAGQYQREETAIPIINSPTDIIECLF